MTKARQQLGSQRHDEGHLQDEKRVLGLVRNQSPQRGNNERREGLDGTQHTNNGPAVPQVVIVDGQVRKQTPKRAIVCEKQELNEKGYPRILWLAGTFLSTSNAA
jgi:ribosomal protein S30